MSNQLTSTKSKWSMALAAILLICAPQVWAQTLGDYRSVATGNWSSNSTWQYYDGSAWVAATSYPGEIATINDVTLQSPFIVTVDVDPNFNGFQMVDLIVNVGATLVDTAIALSYQIAPTTTFVVNGTVDLDNTTILTSSVFSAVFTISATGVFSAHVVFLVRVNNAGTSTVTQRLVNLAAINAGTNQGIWINQTNSVLNFGGATIEAGLRADNSGNTVNYYSASTDQTIRTPIISYRNLTLSGAGGRTKTLSAATSVLGTVSIQNNSILSLGGFNLSVGGDWNVSSTAGAPLGGTTGTTITFNGSIQQNIINTGGGSGTTFNNVTVNNTFGTSPQINIQAASAVDGTLTMSSGNINLNGFMLSHGPSAGSLAPLVHSGLASAGWIYGGTYRKSLQNGATIADGSVSGLFPVGSSQSFRPLYISSPSVAINGALVSLSVSSATNVTDVNIADTGGPIVRQHQGHWQVTSTATTGLFNLNAGGTGFLYIGSVNDLRLSLASSVVGSAGVNSGTTTVPFIQRTGLTPAQLSNTFYLGSVDKISSPLPVELITFTGEAEGSVVNLKWVTRTELNCDYFTVLRSQNGSDFVPIGTRNGAGTSKEQRDYELQDDNPLQGINYYRLVQTDFDGTANSIAMIAVEANGSEATHYYPRYLLGGQNIHIQLRALSSQSQLDLYLINATGQTVERYVINTDREGSFKGDLPIPMVTKGVYFLKLNQTVMRIFIQ